MVAAVVAFLRRGVKPEMRFSNRQGASWCLPDPAIAGSMSPQGMTIQQAESCYDKGNWSNQNPAFKYNHAVTAGALSSVKQMQVY
jgi:hypothetical protein